MADDGKGRPKLEFYLAPGDNGNFSFGGKGGAFSPKLYVRYFDENGNRRALKAPKGAALQEVSEEGLGTLLDGMPDIGLFLKDVLPRLTRSGRLPSDYDTVGTVKLISDGGREYVRERFDNALNLLNGIVSAQSGSDQAAINNAVADGMGGTINPDINSMNLSPLAKGKYLLRLPSLAKMVAGVHDAGYRFHRENPSDPKSFYHWTKGDKGIVLNDAAERKRLEKLGFHPDILYALEEYMLGRDGLIDLYDTEGAEKTLSERLGEAVKSGDFNPLFGPHAPNYMVPINKPYRTDDGDEIVAPLIVGGKDASEKIKKYPRYYIDLFDLNTPFFERLLAKADTLNDPKDAAKVIKLNKETWDAKAKEYIDNAHKHTKITIKQDKDGTKKKGTHTYYSISPAHLLAMPEKFRNHVFKLIGDSGDKAFPGLLDAGDGLLRHMYTQYISAFDDSELTPEEKQAIKEASAKSKGAKGHAPEGKVYAVVKKDSEGNVTGAKSYDYKDLVKKYKRLVNSVLKNDGYFNNRDKYMGMYGKKVIEDPNFEEMLKSDDIKKIVLDSYRNGDPTGVTADLMMESAVNLLKSSKWWRFDEE